MGHGPARELAGPGGPVRDLNPELAPRLSAALEKLDAVDADFKAQRDEERIAQLVKAWHAMCRDIDENLRNVAKTLIASHQISLDIGSDGGGIATKPFMEDMRGKFAKLQFKLNEDRSIDVVAGDLKIGRGSVDTLDYDFVEKMVVEWVIQSAKKISG